MGLKVPILYAPTRWTSIYQMLESVIEYKSFCLEKNDPNLVLTNDQWQGIDKFLEILKPIHKFVILLQKEQLFLGDFIKEFMNLEFILEEKTDNNSKHLCEIFKKRKNLLFTNKIISCGIFLDPRLSILQSDEEKQEAKECLKNIFKLHFGNEVEATEEATHSSPESDTESENIVVETMSPLERHLRQLKNSSRPKSALEIALAEIQSFNCNSMAFDCNIMEYWHLKRFEYPNVTKLAELIHSVPCTQVSVERSFSTLKFLLSDYRSNIDSKCLENTLIIKLN